MKCERAERAILERGLSLLDRRESVDLDRHLRGCRACRSVALAESRIDGGLSALGAEFPPPIDVSARVMVVVGDTPPGRELSDRQIAWGAAWAAMTALALLAGAIAFHPFVLDSIRFFGALVEGVLALIGAALRPVIELAGALARVGGKLLAQFLPADALWSLLATFAVASGVACCLLLLATTGVVLGRDVLRLRLAAQRGDT